MRKYEPLYEAVRPEPSERRKQFKFTAPQDGQLFYKFQIPNLNSLYTLSQEYFWFSIKNELNDPHELKVKAQDDASDEEIKKWAQWLCDEGEYGLIGNKENLNNILNNLNGEIEQARSYWIRSINQNIDQVKNIKIFCASEKYSSPTMWSHYTANHTGWAIGFDSLRVFNNFPPDAWFKVRYKQDVPEFGLEELFGDMEYQHKLFATKFDEWEYEQEWRCAQSTEHRAISINTEAVKCIIFGMHCDESTKLLVSKLTKDWDIEYFDAKPCEDRYELCLEKSSTVMSNSDS